MKDQARKYFLNLWYNSFPLFLKKYRYSTFFVYNRKIGLRRKLCILKEEEFSYTKDELMNDGELFFVQDRKNMHFWCHYYKVWRVFESKFGYDYEETEKLISGILEHDIKSYGLTSHQVSYNYKFAFEEDIKLYGLTPVFIDNEHLYKLNI